MLRWYSDKEVGRAEVHGEGLVGGADELRMVLADAAACAPHRFLDLVPELAAEGFRRDFCLSILRGAATHLRYRFGNLRPESGRWEPEEPLPDGPPLAERILGVVERYGEIWQDERTAAQILEGCAAAVEGRDSVARLVWQLFRLARSLRPEHERVRFDPDKRTEVDDLMMDAINEPRGIAATTAMELANGLAERGEAWPELLEPLLCRLASDPVASVRAGILRHLPYLHSKEPETGWGLLARCLTAPHPALWELAGETLYYQLRHQFSHVTPYLDRMLAEAPGQADETWSRLMTLALLEGHIIEDDLFRQLTTLDRPRLWKGAASVFAANIGQPELALACRSGLWRILDCIQTEETVLTLDHRLMCHVGFQTADLRLVEKLLDCIGASPRHRDLMGLPEWLATAARREPMATVPLLEKLAAKLEGPQRL